MELYSEVHDGTGAYVLLVCGEREKRFAANRAFAEREIPGIQVVGTPAGHAVNIEAAAEFNAAVVDFAARHI